MIDLIKTRLNSSQLYLGDTTFINPFSYLQLRKNRHLIQSVDNIEIDGAMLVLLMRLFLGWKVHRVSFDMTSLAPKVFSEIEGSEKSIYFIGSKPDEVESAIEQIKTKYPLMNIMYCDGYFEKTSRDQELLRICQVAPDVLVVGMGTPLQEEFLIDLRKKGWKGRGFTCGGFLHQTAKGIQYYPKWIDKFNLRWMYRIYDEPKLFKRYTVDYTKFLFVFAFDVFKYKFLK